MSESSLVHVLIFLSCPWYFVFDMSFHKSYSYQLVLLGLLGDPPLSSFASGSHRSLFHFRAEMEEGPMTTRCK